MDARVADVLMAELKNPENTSGGPIAQGRERYEDPNMSR
jgi:hypothetical protein